MGLVSFTVSQMNLFAPMEGDKTCLRLELKTVVLLGIIFCISIGLLQMIAAAEVKSDENGKDFQNTGA